MEILFETEFVKSLKKQAAIKKLVQRKVDMIIEAPVTMGEPLKGNFQGFYSCPVKRNFIIIYLYCRSCRRKGDDVVVACADCLNCQDETLKFVLLGPHDKTYGI
jgi:addiction module RelE/StbE family toxin